MSHLGAGGISIAQSMGARIIDLNTHDEKERRLMNVVEEMAIASGAPVPIVGILDDEENVNAFAAAMGPRDAVVVVTRGALETFTRDELQAVVGHEFSHLLNGDSKMNVVLAGWVWGLFFLTIVGRMLMQGRRDSESRSKGAGVIILIGLATFIVGLVGHFFGQLIQALISRQREFLADASSVQFTRNPGAMLSTLSKLRAGTSLRNPSASGLAHFFFAPANAFNGFTGLLATHPPVDARMRAIDKNYQSFVGEETPLVDVAEAPAAPVAQNTFDPMTLVGMVATAGVLTTPPQMKNSHEGWAMEIQDALETAEGAQAVLLSMALPHEKRNEALNAMQGKLAGNIFRRVYELEAQPIKVSERFALAQLAIQRLRGQDASSRITLLQALNAAVDVDGALTGFEAMYVEWVAHALGEKSADKKFPKEEAASRVLSYLYSHQKGAAPITDEELEKVLNGLVLKDLRAIRNVTTPALREALPALKGYNFLLRRELLIAAGRVLKLDSVMTDEEAETLRLLAGILDCPLPARIV